MFSNITNYITSKGYNFTGINYEDEYYYAKNYDELSLINYINSYNSITLPEYLHNLISDSDNDFYVIYTEITTYKGLLQINIDIDKCDYLNKNDYIRINNINGSGFSESVDIKKYFEPLFIEMPEDSLNNFVKTINKRGNYEIFKIYDDDLDDNVVFVQINVLVNNKLKKLSKPKIEQSEIFFLQNDYICKYNKKGDVKKYFDISFFSDLKKQEIIDILNSWYENLTIIKKPINNELSFAIKGQEFLKNTWHKYEGKYYPIINDNIELKK